MRLDLVARRALAGHASEPVDCQLLLEGDWPEEASTPPSHLSLDGEIDGSWDGIDREADATASELLGQPIAPDLTVGTLRVDWLCWLELRYYIVKLLRVVAFLDRFLNEKTISHVRLFVEADQDGDYRHLVGEVCRNHGVDWEVVAAERPSTFPKADASGVSDGRFESLRDTCGRLHRRFDRIHKNRSGLNGSLRSNRDNAHRPPPVILCGNPTLFDPLCAELVRRQTPVYWLVERFAFRLFARWWGRGVRLLTCSAQGRPAPTTPCSRKREHGTRLLTLEEPLRFHGVDLKPPVTDWLAKGWTTRRTPAIQSMRCIDEHYERIGPGWLLVDEDATPLKRLAVALAKARGIKTGVIQHGAPYVAFGFAPLAADRLYAWGESSRRQFRRWGVADESLVVTGCPKHDAWFASAPEASNELPLVQPQPSNHRLGAMSRLAWACLPPKLARTACSRKREQGTLQFSFHREREDRNVRDQNMHLLLLASVHHAPERPDIVGFHLTARTNAGMVRWVLEALEKRAGWRLTLKLHPRTPDESFFAAIVDSFPNIRSRVTVVRRGDVLDLARSADCVLSCASSAGIEAMIAGKPVIQLMPAGSVDLVDPDDWGFAGTARSGRELERLLSGADRLAVPGNDTLDQNFANRSQRAAARIADDLERRNKTFQRAATGRERLAGPVPSLASGAILVPKP